jgi:hypothetical protein
LVEKSTTDSLERRAADNNHGSAARVQLDRCGWSGCTTQLTQVRTWALTARHVGIETNEAGEFWGAVIPHDLKVVHLYREKPAVGVPCQLPGDFGSRSHGIPDLLDLPACKVDGYSTASGFQPKAGFAAIIWPHAVEASDGGPDRVTVGGQSTLGIRRAGGARPAGE